MKRFLLTSLAVLTLGLSAQADPALAELPVRVGQVRVDNGPDGHGIYSVSVSGPLQDKSQEIRFIAYWDGSDRTRTTRTATVKSGKSKTLAATIGVVDNAFSRFLSAPKNVKNEGLAKIGDIKYGGELVIVAESDEVLRFDYLKPEGATAIRFGRNEIAEFSKLLKSAR